MRKPIIQTLILSSRSRTLKKADRARDQREPARAATLYRSYIAQSGASFPVLIQFGNALKDSGAFEEAETIYRSALAIKPTDADCHLQLGHLMKISGRREQARELYLEANRLDPTLTGAIEEIGAFAPPANLPTESPSDPSEDAADHLTDEAAELDIDGRSLVTYARIMNQIRWRRN